MKKNPLQLETEHMRLSHEEKALIQSRLWAFVRHSPVRNKTAIRYNNHTTPGYTFLSANIILRPMAITLIIALLVGGGVSYAAEGSLPGDAFYPVKVEVNERVRAWAAVSGEAKTEWQTRLVERRLEEAETLAAKNRLTTDTRSRIEANFERHAERVAKRITELEAKSEDAAAADISSKFETSLRTHTAILERLNASADTETSVQAEIEPLILKLKTHVDSAAKVRAHAETRIATSTSANVKTAAEGRLTAAENKIAEVRAFIKRSSADAEAKAEAEARLLLAVGAVADGKAKIESETYNEAFLLFQKAHRLAQEAQLVLHANARLPIDIQIEIQTNGRTRTMTEQDQNSRIESEIRIDGSIETDASAGKAEAESETRGSVEVDIGL